MSHTHQVLITTAALMGIAATTTPSQAPLTLRRIVTGDSANLPCWQISPDGRQLAFIDGDYLVLGARIVETGTIRVIARGQPSARLGGSCLWSPDGRTLAFIRHEATEELHVIPVSGGESRVVHRQKGSEEFTPLSWTRDGSFLIGELAAGPERSIARLEIETGNIAILRKNAGRPVTYASVSPDGHHLAFALSSPDGMQRDLLMMTIDGLEEQTLAADGANNYPLGWLPDGQHLLFVSAGIGARGILALEIDKGKRTGHPIVVRQGMGRITPAGIARDGTLYAAVYDSTSDIYVAALDEQGRARTQPQRLRLPIGFRPDQERGQGTWSPDGEQMVYTLVENGVEAVAVQSIANGSVKIYPVALRLLERPSWFPDGRAIAIKAGNNVSLGVYRVDLNDGATMRLVERGNYFSLSADGEYLFYSRPANNVQTIWKRHLGSGAEEAVDRGPRPAMKLSPDGQSVAVYVLEGAGDIASAPRTASIMVVPSTGGARRPIARGLRNTEHTITWSHDSQHVLFVTRPSTTGGSYEVWRVSVAGGNPEPLGIKAGWIKHLSMTSDGRKLALSVVSGEMELWSMSNLLAPSRR